MVGFPLLLIPLAIYNCVAFLMPTVSFAEPLFEITLVSGAKWPVTLSDVLLALGIVLLLLEVIKGARPGAKFLTDHLLSFIVFAAAAAQFVMWPKFGTSTFLLLTLLSLVDFLTGISLRTRRRAVVVYEDDVPSRRQRKASAPEPEVEAAPAPAPKPAANPSAASVAESVLLDRPETSPAQPATPAAPPSATPANPSPEVASPGIQPANDAHPSPDTPPRDRP